MNYRTKALTFACFSFAISLFLATSVKANDPRLKGTKSKLDTTQLDVSEVSAWLDQPTDKHLDFKKDGSPKSRRTPSGSKDLSERSLSADFKKFRDEKVLKIKTPEQIDALITEIDKNYDTYTDDVKVVAMAISALKPARGFLYRARPFAEGAKVLHSAVLSEIRKKVSAVKTLLPAPQWNALLLYVAEPASAKVMRFGTDVEAQLYLLKEVYPTLGVLSNRLKKLSLTSPVAIDNQIFFGQGSFSSDLDRYHSFSDSELYAVLSEVHQLMANITFLVSYRWTDIFKVYSSLGTLYGIDGFRGMLSDHVEGAPARERVEAVKEYTSFLTLRPTGETTMKASLRHLKESVAFAKDAWIKLEGRPADYQSYIDPASVNYKTRQAPLVFETWEQMLNGQATIVSQITGETIKIDLPKFFTSPPRDLKDFLATDFVAGATMYSKQLKDGTVECRNYIEGSPAKWDLNLYKTYIVRGVDTYSDIQKAARVLNQSWGGDLIGRYFQFVVE